MPIISHMPLWSACSLSRWRVMSVTVQEYFWRISTVYEAIWTHRTNFSVSICYFISLLNILISNTNLFAVLEYKLDGVDPVDYSPPPISPTPLSKKNIIFGTCETWHVTPGTWHLTHDTWHLPSDTWWGVNILSKFKLSSSDGLSVLMIWRFRVKGSLN